MVFVLSETSVLVKYCPEKKSGLLGWKESTQN